MGEFEPFHSAVNRIPMLRRGARDLASRGHIPLLRDGACVGHDALHPELWNGYIDLEITVRTPLIYGEQKEGENGTPEAGRPQIKVPTQDIDDKKVPYVPPTMIKGMISRAYETLTCSRFRVFGDAEDAHFDRKGAPRHSARLTYRGTPREALGLVPLRITRKNNDGSLVGELLRGDTMSNEGQHWKGKYYPTMRAASLQASPSGHATCTLKGGFDRLEKLARHGKHIHCKASLCLHGDNGKGAKYSYWHITHIFDDHGIEHEVFRINNSTTVVEREVELDNAYVYRTAPDGVHPEALFRTEKTRKHDERVFFDMSEHPTEVAIPREEVDRYRTVIESYVAERKAERRPGSTAEETHHSNRATKAMEDGEFEDLNEGSLAYAVVDDPTAPVPRLLEVVPMMIGRRSYSNTPWSLATSQGMTPLTSHKEASPAERLFGYVAHERTEDARNGDVAARGHLRFGPVKTTEATISTKRKRLAPLLSPKLGSARRFLTDKEGKTPRSREGGPLARRDLYTSIQALGAAAYPVHRKILDRKDFPEEATQALESGTVDQSNDKVRLNAVSWIESGSILRCRVSFSNLEEDELAALIWVLTPENLVPDSERAPGAVGYLRMGIGKPLGLGVMEVRIAKDGLHAQQGSQRADDYRSLESCDGLPSESAQPEDFTVTGIDSLKKCPWVRAFLRASYGYTDKIDVRYMTIAESKANNTVDFRTGRPKDGYGLSPEDITTDKPEPIHVRPPQPPSFRRGPRRR